MNRRSFLFLLGLTGCKCELENMNIAKYEWWKGGSAALPPAEIGTLFDDDFARALLGADYTASGFNGTDPGPSYSLDGSKMQFQLSYTSNRSTNVLYRNDVIHGYSDWTLTCEFTLNEAYGSTKRGIMFGMRTYGTLTTGSWEVMGAIRQGASNAAVIWVQNGGTSRADAGYTNKGTITYAYATGVKYRGVLKRYWGVTGAIYDFEIFDISSTPVSRGSITYEMPLNDSSAPYWAAHRTVQPAIWSTGGDVYIHRLAMETAVNANVNYLFIGDSITAGLFADDVASRWAQQVADDGSKTYEISAGPGDTIEDFAAKVNATNTISKLSYYNPQTIFIFIGTNNIVSDWANYTTWRATYQTAVNTLKSELPSANIVHLYAIPRAGSANINTWNSWLNSTFGGTDTVIDINTPLNDGSNGMSVTYSPDNIHPNQAGNDLIASTILAAL